MIHNETHLRSLESFIRDYAKPEMSYDKILNKWMSETGIAIHDADTIAYYLLLVPKIERRYDTHVTVLR